MITIFPLKGAIVHYNLHPDLNPIEKFWANMKRWIRNKIAEIGTLSKAISAFFVT